MRTIKLFFTSIAMLLGCISVYAQFEVDGIKYHIVSSTERTVEVGYKSYGGSVTIPEKVIHDEISYSVIGISQQAFADSPNLTKIEIPKSVTYCEVNAFHKCEKLTEVHISDLSSWCNITFYHTLSNPLFYAKHLYLNGEEIKDLVIPDDVKIVKYATFYNCEGLTSVVTNNRLTNIEDYAFYKCTNLSSVSLGKDLSNIGNYAFYGCTKLSSVSTGKNLSNIGDYAFYGCSNLSSLSFWENLSKIGDYAFYNCKALVSISFPTFVTSIGQYSFSKCTSLTKVFLGRCMTVIGSAAFSECSNLKYVINNSNLSLSKGSDDNGRVGYYAKHIISVENFNGLYFGEEDGKYVLATYLGNENALELPDSYNGKEYGIYDYAFYDCKDITSITIPNNVTSIGSYALTGTSITSIEIPSSVGAIGNNAFTNTPLRTIVSKSENPATFTGSSLLFSNYTYIHAPLYVPEGAYWNYAYANGWGDFIQIKEMVMSEEALQSNKAYMIADSKGCNYQVYDAQKDAMKTVAYAHALDEENEECCWTVIKENGNTYLYNLGAKKFGGVDNKGALTLSETPVNVTISEDEKGLSINGNNYMFVLNKNIAVDVTGISDVILNGADVKNAQIHSLDGRRQQNLTRGVNIVNGKKVLVK